MNEQDQSQSQLQGSEQTGALTPPPFRPDEQLEAQEPAASPTLAQRIEAMGLDEGQAQRVMSLTQGLTTQDVSDDLLTTLARGITHDEDVQNADAAGYLRGRNEKIEAVLRPEPEQGDEQQATPVFPRYCRRSIWDS